MNVQYTFRYPDSFVQLLGYKGVYFHLSYRHTEGIIRARACKEIPSIPEYSTTNTRGKQPDIKINEQIGTDIVIALGSTGIKVANMGNRYDVNGIRRGYLKIHVAVHINKKKIVSREMT